MKRTLAVIVVAVVSGLAAAGLSDEESWMEDAHQDPDRDFTNMWVAEIQGGESVARRIARDYGYHFEGPAKPFEDHYVFTRDDHPEVSKMNSRHLTKDLLDIEEVKWAEQQALVKRSLRGYEKLKQN